jgi:hypothetical protein
LSFPEREIIWSTWFTTFGRSKGIEFLNCVVGVYFGLAKPNTLLNLVALQPTKPTKLSATADNDSKMANQKILEQSPQFGRSSSVQQGTVRDTRLDIVSESIPSYRPAINQNSKWRGNCRKKKAPGWKRQPEISESG